MLMLHSIVVILCIVAFNNIGLVVGWNPANFSFNPGDAYELVWQDAFENVGPTKAIIDGQSAYAPNPKNWYHLVGRGTGSENFTDSIYNAYVQNNQLIIVAMKEGYTSAMLSSENLQEFTFGIFAAKIRLPYGRDHRYNLSWPTTGEIDIMEMWGDDNKINFTDQFAHATIHWNNESDSMNPLYHKYIMKQWETPDGSMLHNNSLVYWANWTPTNISIGVNEFTYFQINTTNMSASINPVVAFSGLFPYCMWLDVAITRYPPGPPDNTTIWPQKMIVDWVRVYQPKKLY